jgi:hypothetical protein
MVDKLLLLEVFYEFCGYSVENPEFSRSDRVAITHDQAITSFQSRGVNTLPFTKDC